MSTDASTLGQLRRLARDNLRMGPRLAEYEYREMCRELENDALFDLNIDFGDEAPAGALHAPSILVDAAARRLPVLNVPLGSIAWQAEPQRLPTLGIYLGDAAPEALRQPFRDLMLAHHSQPFARLVFLCQGVRVVPFLGRYGFAVEHVGRQAVEDFAPRMRLRFGLTQIRELAGGRLLWKSEEI